MSISDRSTPDFSLWGTLFSVLLLVLAGLTVSAGERAPGDLQLSAPTTVRPHTAFPLIALHFGREPGDVGDAVRVQISIEQDGTAVGTATLEPSATMGFEGSAPGLDRGEYLLVATAERPATEEGSTPIPETVRRPLSVREQAAPLNTRGRMQTELQRWSPRPVVTLVETDAPEHLDARVVGGACIAGATCELLIWVGSPAARVGLLGNAGVVPIQGPECGVVSEDASDEDADAGSMQLNSASTSRATLPTPTTSGVVRCELRVLSSEGTVRIAAFNDAGPVAYRELQLPIAFATPTFSLQQAVSRTGQAASVLSDEAPLSFDIFHEDVWRHHVSTREVGPVVVPLFDAPGLWRFQARRSPFGSEHAASRLVYVSESAALAATALSQHSAQTTWVDPMARQRPECEDIHCSDERLTQFMMTAGELETVVYPTFTSGRLQTESDRPSDDQDRLRLAVLLITLAGLWIAAFVVYRGLAAVHRAERILDDSGQELGREDATPEDEEKEKRAHALARRKRRLVVWAAGLFVFLVFLGVAAIVISRAYITGS